MKKTLLTESAVKKLKKELDELILIKRKEIAERIEKAKELGDLSENAEYHAAKEAQAKNETEIQKIKNMLDNYELVQDSPDNDKISINSKVDIKYLDSDEETTVTIVPSIEADPFNGKISNESPIGKALLNHVPGETIPVEIPDGILNIKILDIN